MRCLTFCCLNFADLPDDGRVRSIVLGRSTVLMIGTFEALFHVATTNETVEVANRRGIRFGARPDEMERRYGPNSVLRAIPPGGLDRELAEELGVTDLGAVFQLAEAMTGSAPPENFDFLRGVLLERRAGQRAANLRRLEQGMPEVHALLRVVEQQAPFVTQLATGDGSPPSAGGPRTPAEAPPVDDSPGTPEVVVLETPRRGSRKRHRSR